MELERVIRSEDSILIQKWGDRLNNSELKVLGLSFETNNWDEILEDIIKIKKFNYLKRVRESLSKYYLKEINTERLYLYNRGIKDIGFIKLFTNLGYLDLEGNKVEEISPIANLTNLKWLSLSYNKIEDISPLANLTNLEYLSLWENNISKEQVNWLRGQLPNTNINY